MLLHTVHTLSQVVVQIFIYCVVQSIKNFFQPVYLKSTGFPLLHKRSKTQSQCSSVACIVQVTIPSIRSQYPVTLYLLVTMSLVTQTVPGATVALWLPGGQTYSDTIWWASNFLRISCLQICSVLVKCFSVRVHSSKSPPMNECHLNVPC